MLFQGRVALFIYSKVSNSLASTPATCFLRSWKGGSTLSQKRKLSSLLFTLSYISSLNHSLLLLLSSKDHVWFCSSPSHFLLQLFHNFLSINRKVFNKWVIFGLYLRTKGSCLFSFFYNALYFQLSIKVFFSLDCLYKGFISCSYSGKKKT